MGDKTEIAWTDSTFNPWIGCTKVGPGCDNCYAEREFDHRHRRAKWGAGQERSRTSVHNWHQPVRWNARPFYECPACGWRGEGPVAHSTTTGDILCPVFDCIGTLKSARRRVFCASLADVFDNEVPEQWRADLFALIAKTPNLDWLLLTKRIGNAEQMMRESCGFIEPSPGCFAPRPNLWLGATVVNQAEADRDIPKLLAVPAAVRWLSMEPLLGPVDLRNYLRPKFRASSDPDWQDLHGPLDWVVAGGESGPKARPMHSDWVRWLRDQCEVAGTPLLFKQWGEYLSAEFDECPCGPPDKDWVWADGAPWTRFDGQRGIPLFRRVGKKAAGRLLDGKLHDEFPVRPAVAGVDPAAPGADRAVYPIPAFLRRKA